MCFLSGPFLRAPKGELVLERLPQGMAPSILLGAQTWPSSRSSSAGFSLKGEAAGGLVGLFPQGSAPDVGAFLPRGAWLHSQLGQPPWGSQSGLAFSRAPSSSLFLPCRLQPNSGFILNSEFWYEILPLRVARLNPDTAKWSLEQWGLGGDKGVRPPCG